VKTLGEVQRSHVETFFGSAAYARDLIEFCCKEGELFLRLRDWLLAIPMPNAEHANSSEVNQNLKIEPCDGGHGVDLAR
jgi:hypothetical protein